MQQTLPFPPTFSDHILFIFLYFCFLLCPAALLFFADAVPLAVSTDFLTFIRRKDFFLDFFCKFAEVQCLSGLQSTFFQHGIVILCHFISGFAMSAPIIRTGRADLIRIRMKPYFLSLQKNLQHLGHMCSKTVTVAFPLKIRQAHTMMRAQRNNLSLCALIGSICRGNAFILHIYVPFLIKHKPVRS